MTEGSPQEGAGTRLPLAALYPDRAAQEAWWAATVVAAVATARLVATVVAAVAVSRLHGWGWG
jgi:hypothetical protein